MFKSVKSFRRGLIARADLARDGQQFREAAVLYEEALRLTPDDAAVHIQRAHMLKEAGDLDGAERHYQAASLLTPSDADLALQLGHLYKTAGNQNEAIIAYQKAAALRPAWTEPARELAGLKARGWPVAPLADAAAASRKAGVVRRHLMKARRILGFAVEAKADRVPPADPPREPVEREDRRHPVSIVPELVPRRRTTKPEPHREGIVLRHAGRLERRVDGMTRMLRGVEAMRGFCVTATPLVELQIFLNDAVIVSEPLGAGLPLRSAPGLRKYAFNVWHDFSHVPDGPATLTFVLRDTAGRVRRHREAAQVSAPRREAEFPGSDAVVELRIGDPRAPVEQINTRPSVVRVSNRRLWAQPPQTILVLRTDQLGDLVCSLPAIYRLRALFPQAKLIGLLTSSNADLASTLTLFDDVVLADFPDDLSERRRTMTVDRQIELRRTLESYSIDCAIDLSDNDVSRPLLLLSGASFLYGFNPDRFPWLSGGVTNTTRDPGNGLECVSTSSKILGLVEVMAVHQAGTDLIQPPLEASRSALEGLGLATHEPYIVLHAGARLAFSRWPHFAALAALVVARTSYRVVVLSPDEPFILPQAIAGSGRIIVTEMRLPFADLDALLSFAVAVVGNDSGPKHLASLRGTDVVGLHMARHNWSEWGQSRGVVISRRVPCAGCGIHFEPEECAKDFACLTQITPDEVFDAVIQLISSRQR